MDDRSVEVGRGEVYRTDAPQLQKVDTNVAEAEVHLEVTCHFNNFSGYEDCTTTLTGKVSSSIKYKQILIYKLKTHNHLFLNAIICPQYFVCVNLLYLIHERCGSRGKKSETTDGHRNRRRQVGRFVGELIDVFTSSRDVAELNIYHSIC